MAFPTIVDYDTSLVTTNQTSHSQPLPADRASGNLLLCFFTCDNAGVDITINTGTEWVELLQYNGSASTFGVYYKLSAADSAADVLSLTTDSGQHSASIMYAISGHDSSKVPDYSVANGNSTNANPPSLTPTRGRHDYLWFTCMGTDGTVVASATPTDFSDLITYASSSSADGVSISSAKRAYHTDNSAYNPDTFTSASAYWIAITIAVVPLEGPGFNLNNLFLRLT